MRAVVDTNVIIDFVKERDPFFEKARLLMALGYVKEIELWLSSAQASDLFYLLTSGGKHSEALAAKQHLERIRRFLHVCGVGEGEFDAVIDSTWLDIEDALVYQTALKLKADFIITRNQKDFEKSSIKVFDCDELFAYLSEEKGLTYEEIPW